MSKRTDLLWLVKEFEALLALSSRLDARVVDHRREAVAVRRKISELFGAFSACTVDGFADRKSEQAYRNELAKLRSAMANHQASWPVVAVDYDDAVYNASEARVRQACQEFIAWVKRVVKAGSDACDTM